MIRGREREAGGSPGGDAGGAFWQKGADTFLEKVTGAGRGKIVIDERGARKWTSRRTGGTSPWQAGAMR